MRGAGALVKSALMQTIIRSLYAGCRQHLDHIAGLLSATHPVSSIRILQRLFTPERLKSRWN